MQTVADVSPEVARHLFTAERSHSIAARDQALLLASILDACTAANLALKVDQRLVDDAMAGLTSQVATRRNQLELHNSLAAVAIKHGVDPASFGVSGGYTMRQGLQVVRSEAA